MRISHMANPFHHIECWTGTYFRKADLNEVGVYIVIGHRDNVVCPTVETQRRIREDIQTGIDRRQDQSDGDTAHR